MWNVIQCSVQGRSHIKTGIPCQDKTYALNKDDFCAIALADGAGSVSLSHYGAELVTKRICEMLANDFEMYYEEDDGIAIKRKIINDLTEELQKMADQYKCDIKELASTLLAVAVKSNKYIIIHIGDGVIGYLKDDQIKIASYPENGEFVNTTVFVTSKAVLQSMKIMKGGLKGIYGFALMSDGTESSFLDKNNKSLAPVLRRIMNLSQKMECCCLERELEKSFENVIKQNTTDDCSIALLIEEDYLFRGYNSLELKEKEEILGYEHGKLSKKRCRRYDEILSFLIKPNSLPAIARKIHVKKKYVKKYINVLLHQNLIIYDKNVYYTSVIMEKE